MFCRRTESKISAGNLPNPSLPPLSFWNVLVCMGNANPTLPPHPPRTPQIPQNYSKSLNPSDVDSHTGAPAALAGTRFKGLAEEANAVKRRLREKCRRRWVADGKLSSRTGNGGGGGGGIGWTGVSAEERAQYAAVAEGILGPFMDSDGRDDVAFARR